MEFSEVIKTRYSVRAYKPDPVEDEKLAQVIEAARLAPTAVNRQPFQLLVIHTKGKEEDLNRIWVLRKLLAPLLGTMPLHRHPGWHRWLSHHPPPTHTFLPPGAREP